MAGGVSGTVSEGCSMQAHAEADKRHCCCTALAVQLLDQKLVPMMAQLERDVRKMVGVQARPLCAGQRAAAPPGMHEVVKMTPVKVGRGQAEWAGQHRPTRTGCKQQHVLCRDCRSVKPHLITRLRSRLLALNNSSCGCRCLHLGLMRRKRDVPITASSAGCRMVV
jgi:hypothetical protein